MGPPTQIFTATCTVLHQHNVTVSITRKVTFASDLHTATTLPQSFPLEMLRVMETRQHAAGM